MVKLAVEALEEKKGEDVKIIDIEGVSVIADYFGAFRLMKRPFPFS